MYFHNATVCARVMSSGSSSSSAGTFRLLISGRTSSKLNKGDVYTQQQNQNQQVSKSPQEMIFQQSVDTENIPPFLLSHVNVSDICLNEFIEGS